MFDEYFVLSCFHSRSSCVVAYLITLNGISFHQVSEVDEVVNGTDVTDQRRFKAAADVVKVTEKAKKNNDGKITSAACNVQ